MVGGFSSSPYLKGRIKEFKHIEKHIVNPIEAGSAVCRGALAFGAVDAEVMLSRKSKKTYGICVSRGFRMGDPQEYLLEEGGQSYCKNVFGVFVKKDEDVPVDRQAKHMFEVEPHSKIFFTHDGKGWGLRTLEQPPAGAFVCCDGNLVDVPVTIESPDRHYYHVAFFTSRAVKPMEELTWDYRIDFDDDTHPIEAFKCLCGSPFCREASCSKKRKKRGEIQTNMEQEERNNNTKADLTVMHTYPILLDGNWCSEKGLKDEDALYLDATFFGNAAHFINHRLAPS
ncbi:hypothetical protein R1sor_001856 [Riccia sorocarpa]|uniref:SET domain-containing protein n=1 Tax=Riccia sorocarpa TaxID=122646 RepID=A0ABD3GZT4_9MARC